MLETFGWSPQKRSWAGLLSLDLTPFLSEQQKSLEMLNSKVVAVGKEKSSSFTEDLLCTDSTQSTQFFMCTSSRNLYKIFVFVFVLHYFKLMCQSRKLQCKDDLICFYICLHGPQNNDSPPPPQKKKNHLFEFIPKRKNIE